VGRSGKVYIAALPSKSMRNTTAKARKLIRERMTPAQKEAEHRAKVAIVNDFRLRHGLPELTVEMAAMGVT
jgi:hypothetical protein